MQTKKIIKHAIFIISIIGIISACSSDNDIVTDTTEEQGENQETEDAEEAALCLNWQKAIGGSDSDLLYDMYPTSDGGYFLSGASASNASGDKSEDSRGGFDFWVVKVNSTGNVLWEATLGGDQDDLALTGIPTTDGGFLAAGRSKSGVSGEKSEANLGNDDIWITKLDVNGNLQWENSIGGDNYEEIVSIVETTDGYLLGGSSASASSADKSENPRGGPGDLDYWILKTDFAGIIVWEKIIGGNRTDRLKALQTTIDGGYLLAGSSISDAGFEKTDASRGSSDFWIVKANASGIPIWDLTFGGAGVEIPEAITGTTDGGFIVVGDTFSELSGDLSEGTNGEFDYLAIKINSAGTVVWQNIFGGNFSDHATAISTLNDGSYVVGGRSGSEATGDKTEGTNGFFDYWVVQLDAEGLILNQNNLGGNRNDRLEALYTSSDGQIIVAGHSVSDAVGDRTEASFGEDDFWLLSLSCISDD